MDQYSFDVDAGNFQQVVIEGSQHVPVLVDFWAEWCGPCRALKPILEKLAAEFQGKFILAKVDSDKNQDIATQFGVRGIPSVKAFLGGELVDEFSGALPESEVREFLKRLIPSPAGELHIAAGRARDQGNLEESLRLLGDAAKLEPLNEAVRLDAADIMVELGLLDEARRLFDSLSLLIRMEDRAQQVLARLSFAEGGQQSGDEAGLRDRIAEQPDDMETRMRLANQLVASGRHQEGLEELLEMVRRDRSWNEEAARKAILAVFSLLGGQGPLVSEYRRKLARALN
ncbi:MAG: co-chaperone YbbN [Gallionellaceae bacterium]|nr:co-chaperone YbbN [Gallionellaceae bacterium]